jgi:hypothetical protein
MNACELAVGQRCSIVGYVRFKTLVDYHDMAKYYTYRYLAWGVDVLCRLIMGF